MKKRILSMLLAIVMVVGLIPGGALTALAADTGPEVKWGADKDSLTEEDTCINAMYASASYIQLQKDIEVAIPLFFENSVTLDLNGHTLKATEGIIGKGDLTVTDTGTGSGILIVTAPIEIVVNVTGSITVSGGKLISTSTDNEYGYSVWADGDITVQGKGSLNSIGNVLYAGGSITVSGELLGDGVQAHGSITVKDDGDLNSASDGTGVYADGDITVESGSLLGISTTDVSNCGVYASGSITVESGSLHGTSVGERGVYSGKSITVKSGSLTGTTPGDGSSTYSGVYARESISVYDGSLSGTATDYGVKAASGGIFVYGGSLSGTATSESGCGVHTPGSITVTGGSLTGTGNDTGVYAESISVNGGTLEADGGSHGVDCSSMTMSSSSIVIPENGEYDSSHRTIVDAEYNPAQKVRIAGVVNYLLWVGGQQFTSEKLSISGDEGTAVYDPDTNTLTLTDYSYTGAGRYNAAIYYGSSDTLNLVLNGINSVTHSSTEALAMSFGLYTSDSINISGTGSLTAAGDAVSNGNSYGIAAYNNVTVSGGTVTATGGESSDISYGIYADNVAVSGGTVNATGGEAPDISYGIWSRQGIEISGGTVTATGGSARNSYGVYASSTDISGGVTVAEGIGCAFYKAPTIDETLAVYDEYDSVIDTPNWNTLTYAHIKAAPTPEVLWGADADSLTNSGTLADAIREDAAYIQLQKDITSDSTLTFDSPVTIDLNGKTLTSTDTYYGVQVIDDLTITDSSADGNGSLTGTATGTEGHGVWVYGSITVESGSLNGTANSKYGVWVHGSITVESGSLNGESGTGVYAYDGITVKGGSLTATGTGTDGCGVDAYGGITVESGSLTATGSSFGVDAHDGITVKGGSLTGTGTNRGVYTFDGITVEGGSLTGESTGANGYGVYSPGSITVSGGSLTGESTGADGYGVWSNGSITVNDGILSGTSESGTGVEAYGSITVEDGSLIGEGDIGVEADSSITVTGGSLSGKGTGDYGVFADSITVTGGSLFGTGTGYYGVWAVNAIEVSGNGSLTGEGDIGVYAAGVGVGGSITVTGGSLSGTTTGERGNGVYADSSITVTGGSFFGTATDGVGAAALDSITVSGGTLTGIATGANGYGVWAEPIITVEGDGKITATGATAVNIIDETGSSYSVESEETDETTGLTTKVLVKKADTAPLFTDLYAVGNGSDYGGWMNSSSWDPATDSNKLTEVSDGIYEITFTDVNASANYEFKIVADGFWGTEWGGTYTASGVEFEGVFDANNSIQFTVAEDNSTVTIRVDATETEAKGDSIRITVTITPPSGGETPEPVVPPVASVTVGGETTDYTDLTEAIAAAKASEGSTLKLLDNINTNTPVTIASGSFTIDLNGKTWQCSDYLMYVRGTANIRITDTAGGTGKLLGTGNAYTITLYDSANLEIAGGTVENNDAGMPISMDKFGSPSESTLTVSGGTVRVSENSLAYAINAFGKSVTVTGGTIEGGLFEDIYYKTGKIDLSGHSDPAGITIYNGADADVVVSETVFLPEGYALLDSEGNAADTLVAYQTYTVGEAPAVIEYPLWVGGEQITSANADDVFSDGKVSYNPDTNTLTLTDYSYSGEGYTWMRTIGSREEPYGAAICYSGKEELNLVLNGTNSITHTGEAEYSYGFYAEATQFQTNVSGSGSLTIAGNDCSVYTNGRLTIAGNASLTVNKESTNDAVYVGNILSVTDNGSLNVTSKHVRGVHPAHVELSGNGRLQVSSTWGLETSGSVTVSDAAVLDVSAELIGVDCRNLTVNGGTLTVSDAQTGISVKSDFNMTGGEVIASGVTAALALNNRNGTVTIADTLAVYDKEGNVIDTPDWDTLKYVKIAEKPVTLSVCVSAVDAADGVEIAGATLQIIDDQSGYVVEEWVSVTEVHTIEGLHSDKWYTLRAVVAPDGYTIPTDTNFFIYTDGTLDKNSSTTTNADGVLLVEFDKTVIKVNAVDTEGQSLEGAKLEICDPEGNMSEWVSDGAAWEIIGLPADVVYTVITAAAPDGYTFASDVMFSIDANGNVTTSGMITEDGVLLVEFDKTVIKVKAVDTDKNPLEGATLQIITDQGTVVNDWVSAVDIEETEDVDESIHMVYGLNSGVDYILHTTAAPDGYTIPADTNFSISKDGSVSSSGNMIADGVLLVKFEEAMPKITSVTFNSDSDAYDADTNTFYIDEEHPLIITAEGENLLGEEVKFVLANSGFLITEIPVIFDNDRSGSHAIDLSFYYDVLDAMKDYNSAENIAYIAAGVNSVFKSDLIPLNVVERTYEVELPTVDGGEVSTDKENPVKGDEVTITVTPDEGKEVVDVVVKDENGEEVPVTKNEDGTYTYEQPAGDVTVDVTMKDTEYSADITQPDGGEVSTDKDNPVMGDEVTITVTPDEGKEVVDVIVKDENGDPVNVTDNGDGTYTYEQPAGDVTITVELKDTEYSADITQPDGGEVSTDKDNPVMGDEVTITVTPDEGKEVVDVIVKDENGDPVEVTDNGDGTYTYEQPAGDVTITVELKDTEYSADITQPDGGAAETNPKNPVMGEKVTITVTPDEGKEVDKVVVKDENGEEVPVTKNEDGTYSYEQPAGDVTITVELKVKTYTVNFVDWDDKELKSETVEHGKAATAPDAPTREGYTFTSWDKAFDNITGSLTVKATYTINQYTITFDTDGGTAVAPITQDYGTAVTAPADPTKTGYTFAGWDKEIPATMPAENVTITAQWTVNQYTITFDTDGGTAVAPITQDYGTSVEKPADPTKTGYTFNGWDKEIPATMPAENVTITAQWTVNQYTITFDTDGGTAVAPITQDYGTSITTPADPAKTGYTFNGWDMDIPETMPAENVTITAQWTVNQYTITFDTDGGTAVAPITQDYGTAVTTPADPTKTGYTFAGWDMDIPATMPAENVTITAQWTVNQYTITFDTDGGTAVAPITQDYGTSVEKPADPAKTGFDFGGWYADAELTKAYVFGTMPAENITVYAKWNPADGTAYTVKHYHQNTSGSGYTLYESETLRGTTNDETAAEAKNYPGFTAQTVTQTTILPDGTAVVEIKYDRNTYTVTLVANKGIIRDGDVTEYTYGVGAKLPTNVTRSGHYFGGWYDNEDCKGTPVTEITTADIGNKTFYAKWNVIYIPAVPNIPSNPAYPPVVNDSDNGDVDVSHKNPDKGDTVTITPDPDAGYAVDEIIVTDKNGNPVKVVDNGDGTYSFKQPSGKVNIEVTFKEIAEVPGEGTPSKPEKLPFTDVPNDAYYAEAVRWALENGVTSGSSDTLFNPNGICTRAQAVTFLWRAAGSPAPESTKMLFKDVPADAYYYKAVLWAVENGITKGTSDTTFSPDAECTRAQIVTFLWRSQKSPAIFTANPFTDVDFKAYYIDAVLWAVKNGITSGTSATTFSPDADCTRAQIVTFLYRCMDDEE